MYIPLRVYSAHSVGFGAIRARELAEFCQAEGIPAAGIADRDTLGGVMANARVLAAQGIQPLIGGTFRIAATQRGKRAEGDIVLYAMSNAGYSALLRVANKWNLAPEDKQAAPDLAQLEELLGDGAGAVLAMTGGVGGILDAIIENDMDLGLLLDQLSDIFGDRLYVEIQRGFEGANTHESTLARAAATCGLPLIATVPATHRDTDQRDAHDAFLCIADKTYLAEPARRRSIAGQHLRTVSEMKELFADLPEALENTVEFSRRASFAVEPVAPHTPVFLSDSEGSEEEALRRNAQDGLAARLLRKRQQDSQFSESEYHERLEYEIGIIARMGFAGYFLIVADFVNWAKEEGIPVGPGRGSGAGSLVAWALGITGIDPIEFGLLFERFLNPERVSMPDFDIDFAQGRREEVIDYVRDRYGDAHVAHIATFGTLQARAVVRDVGRVLQIPFPVIDRVAKLIPANPSNPVSLADAMESEALGEALKDADSDIQHVFRIALKLEGLYRHVSTHAAGVIISDRPIAELVPVHRDVNGKVATSFDMKSVEAAGLIKFDFLGLKNLDVIQGAKDFIRSTGGDEVDFDEINFQDEATFATLAGGDGFAAFQLESAGMRQAMKELGVADIEELIALISLYRPGPMEQIASYADVKHGRQQVSYPHPEMEEVLAPTNGVMIYQEQVMEIARRLAGYSLGDADLLRRAMGKKIKEEMDAQQAAFIGGATAGWCEVELDTGETRRLHALTRVAALDGSGRMLSLEEAQREGVEVAL